MADEDKIVKAGIEAALEPFADLIDKLAGPAAKEIGLTLKDHVRVFRLKRQIRLFRRVKEMLSESGMEAVRIPFKLLLPMVENASIEEDNELQDRWAAMIANAALERDVHPSFPEILKQLSEREVLYLDACYEFEESKRTLEKQKTIRGFKKRKRYNELDHIFYTRVAEGLGISVKDTNEARTKSDGIIGRSGFDANVIRLGLMLEAVEGIRHRLTGFGAGFVKACRAPVRGETS